MANRTWGNISISSTHKTFVFAFKVAIGDDLSKRVFSHDGFIVSLGKISGSTNIITNNGNVSLGSDVFDSKWHMLIIEVLSNGDFLIYLDDSIIPITYNDPSFIYETTGDLVIGDTGLALFGLRVINGSLGVSGSYENFIYKDLIENNGNVFFEVA